MALVIKDRVLETSTTTGTGTLTLAGATTGYQSFSTAIGNTNTTYYTISTPTGSEWEVGLGTVGAGTLARTTVLASSNGGSAVNFSAGVKDVFGTYPAGRAVASTGALTSGRVAYATTDGAVTDSANLQFTGNNLFIGQTYDQGTGALQVTGTSTQNGDVVDKQLYLQGGNNLFTYSQDFTNVVWSGSNRTITANSINAPNGTSTGTTITRTVALNESMLRVSTSQAISTTHTLSIFAKVGTTGNLLYLRNLAVDNTTSTGLVKFNLTSATIDLTFGSTYTGKAFITAVGNGWYRCSITGTTPASIANNLVDIGGASSSIVSGTIGDFLYIWGSQLELGSVASTYTPTTTAAIATTNNISVPRGSITTSADATINGLTVGKGGGNIATNTALGVTAASAITTGAQNTLLGNNAGFTGTNNLTTGSNNIIIGYNAAASSATVSNEVTIGNSSITSTRLRGDITINTGALFPRIYIGGTSTSVAGVFNRVAAGGEIYFGEDADTAGVSFRGSAGLTSSSAKLGTLFTGAFVQNMGANTGNNTVRVSLGPHSGHTKLTSPYIESGNLSLNGGYLAFGTHNDTSLIERVRITKDGNFFIGNTAAVSGAKLEVTGAISATTTIATGSYTVATLPAAGTAGRRAYVTDATAPTYLGALTGGGAVVCPVFDNGTAWVSA